MQINHLHRRAKLLANIREFFAMRNVLEVETPLLAASSNPAVHLQSFSTTLEIAALSKTYYLQTSPEFAMKRLLASGSGDIYQICKAFRNQEFGCRHNPEFTLLEWYRLGFNHHVLMDEMDDLFNYVIDAPKALRYTYAEIFTQFLELDPFTADIQLLKTCAQRRGFVMSDLPEERTVWLELLFANFIEPKLGVKAPVFIYDFPHEQAMLARFNQDKQNTAARFEVYFHGMELANGFYELNDAKEQRKRFLADLKMRAAQNLPHIPLDEKFLAALPNLPDCAGVALGLDRLLLITLNAKSLREILPFPIDCA